MAVDKKRESGGSHWAVGMNVTLTVLLVFALVAGIQWIGYSYASQADLTSSGINSLTEATTSLVKGLDVDVKITSLYFKTDIEDKNQDRYRSAIEDLIELYRVSNRSKITAESVNPLQDHDKRKEVFKRLAALDKFKAEAETHREAIERFQDELLPGLTELMAGETSQLDALGALDPKEAGLIQQVRQLFSGLQEEVTQTSVEIADAMASDVPAHGAAVSAIRQSYSTVARSLKNITTVAAQLAAAPGQVAPPVEAYFAGADERYADVAEAMKEEQEKLDKLPTLEFDTIVRELQSETSNPLLVETAEEARVISFRSIWPPIDPRSGASGFNDRKFLGEQKLTSAILRLTKPQKTAAIFVRHGGRPLFFGGFMPGQPQAPYGEMKTQLEDANFSVYEWDLATQDTLPEMDPPPSRMVFVVLRPTPPTRNPMGQPPQEPPFTPEKLETLKRAMGESPRALFLTGYMPGMFGGAPNYEYAEYLAQTWGIETVTDRVLLFAQPIGGDRYRFTRDPLQMTDCRFSDQPVAAGLAENRVNFPLVAPMRIADPLPNEVSTEPLVWFDQRQGLWSASDLSYYAGQQRNDYIVRNPEDYEGEFIMGATATKGDAKVVVVSSSEFATDAVAMRYGLMQVGQGLAIRPLNPGNAILFVNTLHWLNDNTEWMNLGTPIDTATIAVDKNSRAMMIVRGLVLGAWPAVFMIGGLAVWLVRRR